VNDTRSFSLNVEYLTRVEGHGNIVVNVRTGMLEECRLEIVEAPRFFEGMLKGRTIFEAQHITSRICGICACGHTLASLQAAEAAIGLTPSPQTLRLRELLLHLENLDSHLLHIYLLAAPDLLGVPSFVPLITSHEAVVRRALRMKKTVNEVCDRFVGRHVHPITTVIGGFTRLPRPADLEAMANLLEGLRPDMNATLDLLASLDFPTFERPSEYVALVSDGPTYPLLQGDIGSSTGARLPKTEYRRATNEFIVPHSTAKHTKWNGPSYAVGARARFNLNHAKLHPAARQAAETLGLKPPLHNPFLNTAAQFVECVHGLEESIRIVREFQADGLDYREEVTPGVNEQNRIPVHAGSGVGAVEVPRGLLYHHYEVDERGIIRRVNCIIPTGQNLNNIEQDMRALVPALVAEDRTPEEIQHRLEMLVRAYDPCISCSAHFLKVQCVE